MFADVPPLIRIVLEEVKSGLKSNHYRYAIHMIAILYVKYILQL